MAKAPTDVRSLARAHTEAAIKVLVGIMNQPDAPMAARVAAATQILNRGYGALVAPNQWVPNQKAYYVYTVHDKTTGKLIYIGKGSGRRANASAQNHEGHPRIRAHFSTEKAAFAFERRLIKRFKPCNNIVYLRDVKKLAG